MKLNRLVLTALSLSSIVSSSSFGLGFNDISIQKAGVNRKVDRWVVRYTGPILSMTEQVANALATLDGDKVYKCEVKSTQTLIVGETVTQIFEIKGCSEDHES